MACDRGVKVVANVSTMLLPSGDEEVRRFSDEYLRRMTRIAEEGIDYVFCLAADVWLVGIFAFSLGLFCFGSKRNCRSRKIFNLGFVLVLDNLAHTRICSRFLCFPEDHHEHTWQYFVTFFGTMWYVQVFLDDAHDIWVTRVEKEDQGHVV